MMNFSFDSLKLNAIEQNKTKQKFDTYQDYKALSEASN